MCEFCLKHGEGRKWYLEASNYSEDMLSDLRRRKFFKQFFEEIGRNSDQFLDRMGDLDKAPPVVKRFFRWKTVRDMKKNHYGQIVPIEDVEKILSFVNSVVRVACFCRHILHKEEKRYCYGVSMGPNGGRLSEIFRELDTSFMGGPEAMGMEQVDKEEVLAQFREYEKKGLCHSVWTFRTPFIGGICNCDRPDCLAMQMSLGHEIPVIFRAEYVAGHNDDDCAGCRRCMKVCQFGAIGYSAGRKKSFIDPRKCYGCGICRSMCGQDAIRLVDRASEPLAAGQWQ